MRNLILGIACMLLTYGASSQSPHNLDFEQSDKDFPKDWKKMGTAGYTVSVDSLVKISGKNSLKMECTPENWVWMGYEIGSPMKGKKLKLKGYVKTENVDEGAARLFIRMDPFNRFSEEIKEVNIGGTTDWKVYEVSAEYDPQLIQTIFVGGYLSGKGKMWLDNLILTLDDKDIQKIPVVLPPAKRDREFDAGSSIKIDRLSKEQIADLKKLGLVWGFLKYYHPGIAEGKYNWDYELFRILPRYLAPDTDKNKLLTDWIRKPGKFKTGKPARYKEVKIAPDLEWISTSGFSDEVVKLLEEVRNAQRSGEHYYVTLMPWVQNPGFRNENPYKDQTDSGYKLLSLFRYWNMINYYFPYKNLLEEDWKDVLEEFIPKVALSGSREEYVLSILELTARIRDSHAFGMDWNGPVYNYFGQRMLPVHVRFIEDRPVVTGFHPGAPDMGLEKGDVITHIRERSCSEIVAERLKYIPGSNRAAKLRDMAPKLLRTNDSTMVLQIERKGHTFRKELPTLPWEPVYPKTPGTSAFKLMESNIGYIDNGLLKVKDLRVLWDSLQNTRALIIDCRNYPSDFVIYELSRYLLPKAENFERSSSGNMKEPGLFTMKKPLLVGKKNPHYYKGKVLILIDETTQSQAEFHVMAYSLHPNATLLGSPSAGADGNISKIELPGNISTWFSGIGIYYPDGRETQRIGIVPDVMVRPTIQGIREGRDEVLEKALELARKGGSGQ